MKPMLSAVLSAVCLAATPAVAHQFDLECRIDVQGSSRDPAMRVSGRKAFRIRADLAAERFCVNACLGRSVLNVTPTGVEGRSGDHQFQIDKTTGEVRYVRLGLFSGVGYGVCNTEPFSGFGGRQTTGYGSVQFGAFSSSAIADQEYLRLVREFPDLVSEGEKRIQEVTAANGSTVYRSTVAGMPQSKAMELCNRIKAVGRDCILR